MKRKKIIYWLAGLLLFLIWLLFPVSKPLIEKDYSQVIYADDGSILRAFLNDREQWCFSPVADEKIPEKLIQSITYYEDQYFWKHPGVNPVSVVRAMIHNFRSGRVVSGASTLTMQVARMRDQNKRTYFNKLKEILLAFKIEAQFSKDEILSAYVNHAPYGRNIIGYQAASLKYFQKFPKDLSWSEAATLAVLPNTPGMVSPGRNSTALLKKRNFLLNKLFEEGLMDQTTFHAALDEPLVKRVFAINRSAEHLTSFIHQHIANHDAVETSINLQMQNYLEYVCRNYQNNLSQFGINNLCALVVENKTGYVRSYIGSANFHDEENFGQVDGVQAARSSASVIKPFLYALSIDEGLISTDALIHDVPTHYGGFSPSNADHKFRGVVRAREALIRSLNVPAVRLLNSYGVSSYYHFLKHAGVSTLFRLPEEYGLTLILGGAEVTPWDVAQLYRGLALDGNFLPISYLKSDSTALQCGKNQLISEGAAYQIRECMTDLHRYGEEQFWKQYAGSRTIAWKTGTSYGHKDAWAAGITPEYTVVVWSGNFSGEGNNELVGAKSSGTLMIEIMNYLASKNYKWFVKNNAAFKTQKLCSETGYLAGQYCDNVEYKDFPKHAKPLKICPFHKRYELNLEEDKTVCSLCWDNGHHAKNFLVYPSEVVNQLNKMGHYPKAVPPHNNDCTGSHDTNNMTFIYPQDSSKIWLPMDFNKLQQSLVFELATNDVEDLVYWYLDDEYLGTTYNKHEKVLIVDEGWHQMTVSGQNGGKASVSFQVARTNPAMW
ncbi:MAG: penicillin-binding protein 1C [Prolixibacteraceae bacterium]|nr:penicillin-binding protein 1C [Prolixibacteraceae bacterium]